MQKSKFIDGAVVKNSGATLVKHVFLDVPMSKTRRKMKLPADKFLKTHRKMTPLADQVSKTRREISFLADKLSKTHRK